eukprot:9135-Rhodomonas_salina.2
MKLGISYCTESCNKTGSSRVESRHQTVANVPRPCLRRTWDARLQYCPWYTVYEVVIPMPYPVSSNPATFAKNPPVFSL